MPPPSDLLPASAPPSSSFRLEEATIADIHAAMRRGALTAHGLVEGYLARIDAYDRRGPRLNSVILTNPRALAEAEALDAEFARTGRLRPLHGVAVLLKDNIDTEGLQTSAGSLSLAGHLPARDATIVARLRQAGAVVLAKANLHEFALSGETFGSLVGQTLNPYDPTRTPGGSSGGTGAAVAANLGTVGVGTDTVNSVRSPASANSLVGIRPTLGLVSRAGIVGCSSTQDTAGPLARTVADAARLLDAIAGHDPEDAATAACAGRPPAGFAACLDDGDGLAQARLGVLESCFGTGAEHRETNAVARRALDAMRTRGATLESLEEPIDAGELAATTSVHLHEFERDLDAYLRRLPAGWPVHSLREVLASGRFHPGIEAAMRQALALGDARGDHAERLAGRQRLQQALLRLMDDARLDALVFPHQKRLVVPIGQAQAERNGVLGAIAGFPSIVVPGGFSEPTADAPLGVPVGIELLGRPWAEPTLLRLAHDFECSTQLRRPPAATPPLA